MVPNKRASNNRKTPSAPWFSEALRLEKQKCRHQERLWRLNYDSSYKTLYKNALAKYNHLLIEEKSQYFLNQIESAHDSAKKMFQVVTKLSGQGSNTSTITSQSFCNLLAGYFQDKVSHIYDKFAAQSLLSNTTGAPSHIMDSSYLHNTVFSDHQTRPSFVQFSTVTTEQISHLISMSKFGSPNDPCPPSVTKLISDTISPHLSSIFNQMFTTGIYPSIWKEAIIKPLLKKK